MNAASLKKSEKDYKLSESSKKEFNSFEVDTQKFISMSKEPVNNPWTTISGEEKYDNKWINVTEYQVINPAGGKGIYGKVHMKNKAIGIIALDKENYTWLVGQYRYTLNEFSWEIPEGGGPLDEVPVEAAKRELKEETGLTAKKWTTLLRIHLSNSVTDEEGFVFLAEDLEHGESELEETESDLKAWRLPLKEAVNKVMKGEITDSMSMAGLLMVARMKGI
jgi:8-oxo-dGTP pyrophosphatase MutT (NUDIX family)